MIEWPGDRKKDDQSPGDVHKLRENPHPAQGVQIIKEPVAKDSKPVPSLSIKGNLTPTLASEDANPRDPEQGPSRKPEEVVDPMTGPSRKPEEVVAPMVGSVRSGESWMIPLC